MKRALIVVVLLCAAGLGGTWWLGYRVSFDKARTRLNFVPRMDLRRGVTEMAQAIMQRDGLRNFEDPAFSNLKVLRDRFESVHEISTPPEGITPVRVAVVR